MASSGAEEGSRTAPAWAKRGSRSTPPPPPPPPAQPTVAGKAALPLRSCPRRSISGAMPLDVVDLRAFYASPLGHVARRFIGPPILPFLPHFAPHPLPPP